ncbi:ESPR-type extended signal peptide-containing protein, partial [Acinetobacter dispersus]
MNKIYRLVWNKSLSLWTVVSENARGVTKKRNVVTNTSVKTVTSSSIQKYKQYQLKPSLIALTISSVFFTGNVFAATNTGGGAVSNNGSGNSMAISPTQSQCGSDGQASVNGNNGVAVGCGNSVGPVGSNSQGLVNRRGTGSNNYPTGPAGIVSSATAVGKNNKISNTGGASLFGTGNVSEGSGTFHNVGIGQGNLLGGPGYNTAVGIGNEAVTGASSVVIGTDNRSRGGTAIAMGRQTYADANYSIAQGNTATVESTGVGGIAMGHSATVSGARGIAIGSSTATDNNNAPATAANAAGTDSVAVGSGANGTGNQTTAVGRQAKAIGDNSAAYGNQAEATGASSVAVGDGSKAQGANDITLGRNAATASGGSNNIAMGNGVTTGSTGQNVAIGSDGTTANSASADGGAVAIGRGQRARGDGAVAIGDPNTTNGNGAVAVGRNNTAAGDTAGNTAADGAVALGNENQAIGQGSVALGNASRAEQAGSIALGDTANAKAARGIALGSNAVATNADDVALGSGSTTSAATGSSFLTGIAAPASVVSVGDRRIQNLSDGAADTDAVNVRQLKSLKDIVDEQGDTTAAGLGGGSTYDPDTGTVTNPTYNVNGKDVNNVGAAITELDKGWNLQSNGANTGAVKAGDTVDIGTADGEENLQVAKEGNDIKYSLNRDLKVDSVKAGDTVINNDGMTIANGPSVTKSGIDAAGNTISNVADGVAGSDAVNKNQLDNAAAAAKTEVTEGKNITVTKTTGDDGQDIYNVATADDVEFNSIKAGDTVINNDGMTIAGGPSVTKDGIDAGNKTIGNVADGVADSDAVNKGQLDKSSQDLTDKGFGLTAQDGTTVQKKLGEAVEVVGADSNITTKVQDGKVAIELAKDLDVNSVKAGDTVINNDGMSIANGPSVTKSGIDAAGNTISNVGPGVAGTDAVNKDQLDNAAAAAKTEVTEGKNISVTKTTGDDGQDIYNVATADDVEFNNVKVGDTVINNDGMTIAGGPSVTKDGVDAGNKTIGNVADGVADSDAVNKGQLDKASQDLTDKGFGLTAQDGSTVQKKLGEAVEVVGADSNITTKVEDGKVAIELAKDLDVNSVKAGDTVINNDGMSIANGPSVTKSGIDAAGNTISNVGPGVAGTDAVNKNQLDNAAAAAKTEVTEGKNITVTKTTGDDGQDIYNVATADDVEFNNVKVGDVTIDGTTGKISGVVAGDVNPNSTDAINGSQLANNAQSVADALGGGSTVNPDGTVSNPTYNINGTDTNNVGDALAELDKGWTLQSNGANAAAVKAGDTVDIGTADGEENLQVSKEGNDIKYSLNRDLKVDSVTAGDTVINNDGMSIANGPSVTKSGIDVAGNKISNVGPGVAGTDAVNKDQLDTAAAAAKTEVTEGKNITVTKTTGDDGRDIYNVATADDVEFNNVKVGDVTIDGTTGKISGVAAGDVNPDSTDAINGSQLANNAQSVADALGGGSTVNPDGTVSQPNYSVNGNEINNVGDAITALDKGWTLQSNGASAAAVKAGDTVDIGTADGEENLQV